MKVLSSTVRKITITGARGFDSIEVILDDIAPRQGRITIRYLTNVWTAWWGEMGDMTVSEFFQEQHPECLTKNLMKSKPQTEPDPIKASAFMRERLLKLRRKRGISAERACELYGKLDIELFEYMPDFRQVANEIFGEDWLGFIELPTQPTREYLRLTRIVKVVQKGLSMEVKSE